MSLTRDTVLMVSHFAQRFSGPWFDLGYNDAWRLVATAHTGAQLLRGLGYVEGVAYAAELANRHLETLPNPEHDYLTAAKRATTVRRAAEAIYRALPVEGGADLVLRRTIDEWAEALNDLMR